LIKYAYPGDGGIDLPIVVSTDQQKSGITVYPSDRTILHTGMIMEFPVGYCARIIHRSSTERVHRLRVIEGLIDDYRNEILVQVHNMNSYPIVFEHGQRAAQIILFKACTMQIEEANGELRPSKRDSKGFGSSGR
jgi:deoxyuridine 5'-triphosphate nucleotidohydrolase